MTCDLHTHSIYSDGTDTPKQIVEKAVAARLGAVALTDHNTVSGLEEFLQEAERLGIEAVGGVELSTAYGEEEFHLLGFFIPPEHYGRIERVVKEFHVLKEISNMEMVERLNQAGYHIRYPDVKRRNANGNANRAHVAAELLEKGYVSSIQEAFANLLAEGNGFYEPSPRLQLTDAIRLLRELSAVPVLAHPLQDVDEETLRALLPEAVEAGLMGIEAYHSSYDAETAARALAIAEEFSLLVSGGSDYHGNNKPDICLGTGKGTLCVPCEVWQRLRAAAR